MSLRQSILKCARRRGCLTFGLTFCPTFGKIPVTADANNSELSSIQPGGWFSADRFRIADLTKELLRVLFDPQDLITSEKCHADAFFHLPIAPQ